MPISKRRFSFQNVKDTPGPGDYDLAIIKPIKKTYWFLLLF